MKVFSCNSGFSLVEVLISIVLLAIGLLGVAGMQTTAMGGNRTSRDISIATQVAEEMIDRIRTNGGNSPQSYNGIDTDVSGTCNSLAEPAKGDCLQWLGRLADTNLVDIVGEVDVATVPNSKTSRVTVRVTWGRGGAHQITFDTLLELWGA